MASGKECSAGAEYGASGKYETGLVAMQRRLYEQEECCGTEPVQGEERVPVESDPRWLVFDCGCGIPK